MVPMGVIWKRKFPEGHRVVYSVGVRDEPVASVWIRARALVYIVHVYRHIYVPPEAERVRLPSSQSTYTRTMTTQRLQINVT